MNAAVGPVTEGWGADAALVARRAGIPMAIGIAVLTATTIGLGLLIIGPLAASAGGFDLDVVRHLAANRTPFVNQVTGIGGVLGGSVVVSVLWAAAVVLAAWRTRQWTVPAFLVFAIGGEKLTYLFASMVVGRPRPAVESLGHVYATSSFPSGHVGAAITLYGGIAVAVSWYGTGGAPRRWLRVGAAVAVAATAVLVAFSRLYRGHHFPTDVLWGAVLGVVWLTLAWRLVLVGSGDGPPGTAGWTSALGSRSEARRARRSCPTVTVVGTGGADRARHRSDPRGSPDVRSAVG